MFLMYFLLELENLTTIFFHLRQILFKCNFQRISIEFSKYLDDYLINNLKKKLKIIAFDCIVNWYD